MSYDLNSFVTIGTSVTYTTQKIRGEFNDGYANQSSGNFGQWNQRHLDIDKMEELEDLITPVGTYATWNMRRNPDGYDPADPLQFYGANYWYNFYSYFNELQNPQRRDRIYGDAYIKLNLTKDLNIRGTIRKDQFNYYTENITPSILQKGGLQTGTIAGYSTSQVNQNEYNYELIANYNKSLLNNDLGISLLAGANTQTFIRKDSGSKHSKWLGCS